MEMDGGEADQIEELAEIAGAFLGELGAERVLVVHGDEYHPSPVTQVYGGLGYEGIEALLFEWAGEAEQHTSVFLEERYGRQCLMAPLLGPSGECLGMLYADTSETFAEDAVESVDRFARHYVTLLSQICTLTSGPWETAPIDEEPVPPEDEDEGYDVPEVREETDEEWVDESWAEPDEAAEPEEQDEEFYEEYDDAVVVTAEDSVVDPALATLLPDLQEYIMLDWYR